MTTYKEIDIENMTQADIRNIILEGDRISIEVAGVEGVLVRTVEQCLNGLRVKLYGVAIIQIRHFSDYGIGMTVTRVERPIPEVELPTVPGYYLSTKYPLNVCPYMYRLSQSGHWYGANGKITEARMRELMPLTRLVPETTPAKLRDRIDLDKVSEHLEHSRAEGDSWRADAAAIIAAIDGGELDK